MYVCVYVCVCVCVCVCACLFVHYLLQTANPNELIFWGMLSFGVHTVLSYKISGFGKLKKCWQCYWQSFSSPHSSYIYLIFSCLDHNTPLAWWLRFYDACRKDRSPPPSPHEGRCCHKKNELFISFFLYESLLHSPIIIFCYTFFCCGLILCIGYLDVGDRFEVHSNNYS